MVRYLYGSSLALVLALGLALTVTACGKDDSASAGSAEAFEYALPSGWSDQSGLAVDVAPDFGLDSASVHSLAAMDTASPYPPIFAVVTPVGLDDLTLRQFARAALREVSGAFRRRAVASLRGNPRIDGVSPPSRVTPTRVGDVPAMQFDHRAVAEDGSSAKVRNVVVIHDETRYLLRFVAPSPDVDLEAFREILSSWHWN